STQTVFLKIDTRRFACTVAWDPANLRVHVTPLATLALFKTYTVELSPDIRSADGARLGSSVFWQFGTTSVRSPTARSPYDRGIDSPFVTLVWGGNETTPGSLSYALYTGTDSAAVAGRAPAPTYAG